MSAQAEVVDAFSKDDNKAFRKILKRIIFFIALMLIIISLFMYFMELSIKEKKVYHDSDLLSYYVLTDSEIANAPRSSGYYFEYRPHDGRSALSSVVFVGMKNATPIRDYLSSLGYAAISLSDNHNEIWKKGNAGEGKQDYFTLSVNAADSSAILTKVME